MSKLLSDFYDLLLPELPGCAPALLEIHLREVAREFCQDTNIWQADCDPIDLQAGVASYDIEAAEIESEIVRVFSVTAGSDLLWTRRALPDERPKHINSRPPFTLSIDLSQLTFSEDAIPTQTIPLGLKVRTSLQPASTARRLPDFLQTRYVDAIRNGTLSRLMVMAKKPWTDRELAAFYASQWRLQKAFAANQAADGNTSAPLRTTKWQ